MCCCTCFSKSSTEIKLKVHKTFEHIAQAIPNLANENEVQKCFAALKGGIATYMRCNFGAKAYRRSSSYACM